ncbi:MAG: hypothetical protein J7K75_08535 [Desulfuromonas sp.]|nr:hypothetical protein [Desulfuromonas sp.]
MKNSHSVKEAARRVFEKLMATPASELNERLAARGVGPIGRALLCTDAEVLPKLDYIVPVMFDSLSSVAPVIRPGDSQSGWSSADENVFNPTEEQWLAA